MNSIRTFVAVHIPALGPLLRIIDDLVGMGRPVKAVRGDNLHLTLKFLGETDPHRVSEVAGLVQELAGVVTAFEVEVAGLGAFPHAERPTVVWAGFRGAGVDALRELAEGLESCLEVLGYPRERRKFEPHLTLARIKGRPPRELAELLSKHKETLFGVVPVDALVYFQSELHPEGPRYTPLATASLQEKGGPG